MKEAMDLNSILIIVIACLFILIMVLSYVYWLMNRKRKSKIEDEDSERIKQKEKKKKTDEYTKLSIFDFMEFDKIEDNMIVQDGGKKYLMVVECEGVNYDLMSELEKTGVEAGFVQFLNTLRHPIQLYVQTRTIAIESSIENYKERLKLIKKDLEKKQKIYQTLLERPEGATEAQVQKAKLELARMQNMYDYTYDIIENTEAMSQNKNVLRKNYYIIVPYYSSEIEESANVVDEQEKKNIIFSELYTRAQSIVRTLFACSMKCKILDSNGLVELLYIAYNRDESEIFGIDKAISAGYDELYSTAPDILDKRMKALDKEIARKAFDLAADTVEGIRSEKAAMLKRKEKSFDSLIEEMAEALLKENKKYIGQEVAEEAIQTIKTKDRGGNRSEKQTKERTRKVTKSV